MVDHYAYDIQEWLSGNGLFPHSCHLLAGGLEA